MEALKTILAILVQAFVEYAKSVGEEVDPNEIAQQAATFAGKDAETLAKIAAEHLAHFQSAGSGSPSSSSGSSGDPP